MINRFLVCIALFCFLTAPVFAATCSMSTQPINFGRYNPTTSKAAESKGLVTVKCEGQGQVNGTVELSSGSSNSYQIRAMQHSNNSKLIYNLYYNVAAAQIWGDAKNSSTRSWMFSGNAPFNVSKIIYGTMPPHQYVRPGVYNDSIIVTLSFN